MKICDNCLNGERYTYNIYQDDNRVCPYCCSVLAYVTDDFMVHILKCLPHKILDIPEPTERMWITAIKNNLNLFTLCKNQTEAIQLQAVSGNGKLIMFCNNPTIKVWKKAIRQNPYVIENLKGNEEYYSELYEYAANITEKAVKCLKL